MLYIDHVANAIRAASVIEAIGKETDAALERLYPSTDDEPDTRRPTDIPDLAGRLDERVTFMSPHASGYVVFIDDNPIVECARASRVIIEVLAAPGDYLVRGEPIMAGIGRDARAAEKMSVDAVRVARERTLSQDPEYGFRLLLDIAVKALSPGINDPTTAIEVVHELHRLLRRLMGRRIEAPRWLGESPDALVSIPGPDWASYVEATISEIQLAGKSQPQVGEALARMAEHLAVDASPEQLVPLRRALANLETTGVSPGTDRAIVDSERSSR